ncbi:hypothetical protein ACQ4PT_066844 [Festuca glaucescens]
MIPLTSLKKSKTPKSKKKNIYSKFRKMKQRLQYKSVHEEVLNEQPLRSVPPLEGVMPLATKAPPRDDGDEGDTVNVNIDADKKEDAEKKEKTNLFNRSSPMKVVRVCKSMTPDKRSLIIGADFGGVLGMKCSKLILELCRFLMECFDQEECVLDFGERGKIPITVDSIVRVMDVPMGSHPVPYQANIEATNLVFQMLGIHDGKQPTVTSLEKQLGKEYPADDDYLRKFIIYLMSSVFAPTTGIQVSPKCYPAVINTKAIASLNWAGFIIDTLIQTANAKGNKNWFKACMPYLMLKPWFRNKPSIFCYQPSVVDMFIKHHLIVNVDEKMLGQYRTAVINMCTSFEDGVAEFITSLGNSKGHNLSGKHDEEKGIHNRNKRKRRKVPHVQQPIDEVGKQKVDEAEELKGKNSNEVNVDAGLKLPKVNKRKTTDTNLVGVVATKKKVKVTSNLVGVVATKKISGQDVSKTSVQDDQPDANSEDNVVEDEKQTQQMECDVTLNSEVSDVNEQKHEEGTKDTAPSILSPGKLHALNHLQLYGSGSQSSTDTPPAHSVEVNEGITISAKIPSKNKKSVSFSVEVKDKFDSKTSSPVPISHQQISKKVTQAPNESHNVTPSEMIDSSMNRKLELDFASAEPVAETEMQRKICELRDDCPSFDLGLDCPDSQQTETEGQVHQPDATIEEPIIISRNEDNGDSLDKIYATIEMPNTTPATVKGKVVHEVHDSPDNPSSCTPVPHPRRIVKPGPTLQSPYGNIVNKPTVLKSDAKLYNMVCLYGGKSKHPLNDERIIDYGDYYIHLRDLADSVKPGGLISNSTCEIALRVLASELANQKKYVMPLSIATKLRSATCNLDRTVRKAFQCTPSHRLDHKDFIMFSVLQDLTPEIKDIMTGHYYLIVLNLKSGRFEVMDSLRNEGNKGLMTDARNIIGSIKHFWQLNYNESKIDISRYKTVYIQTPKQDTTYDCGYFVLKFIESWDGKRMLQIKPSDMPAFRKLFLKKWMDRQENLINWDELLFNN